MTQLEKDKTAFMAQYWGQQVIKETLFPNSPICNVSSTFMDEYDKWHLELYSLDDITDEDIRFVVDKTDLFASFVELGQRQADMLRGMGYLIPFRGYRVEQIISMGWAKIRKRKSPPGVN